MHTTHQEVCGALEALPPCPSCLGAGQSWTENVSQNKPLCKLQCQVFCLSNKESDTICPTLNPYLEVITLVPVSVTMFKNKFADVISSKELLLGRPLV